MEYRDITFCSVWDKCIHGRDCHRALTKEVQDAADKCGMPVCETDGFDCFEIGEGRDDDDTQSETRG